MTKIIHNILAVIIMIIATLLGIYAQDLSYFLNERNSSIPLTTAISVITPLSMGLYILIPVMYIIWRKMDKYLMLICMVIAIVVSYFTFFVWMMWLG